MPDIASGHPQPLRCQAEIARLFRKGRRKRGPLLMAVACPREGAGDGLVVVTSRKVGNAVTRNRVRRRLREIVWALPGRSAGLNIALVASPQAGTASYEQLREEAVRLLSAIRALEGQRGIS